MKKMQTSTNVGIYSILGGFLNIFQDVPITQFWKVSSGLTCGEVIAAALPIIIGVWAIRHDEDYNDS